MVYLDVLFQAEDGIRYLVRSRGLGDVYKRQVVGHAVEHSWDSGEDEARQQDRDQDDKDQLAFESKTPQYCLDDIERQRGRGAPGWEVGGGHRLCLLYTSEAADERSSVDLGGRRILTKKKTKNKTKPDEHVTTNTSN